MSNPTWLAPILARRKAIETAPFPTGTQTALKELFAYSADDIARMAEALKIACSQLDEIRSSAANGESGDCEAIAEWALERIEALGVKND